MLAHCTSTSYQTFSMHEVLPFYTDDNSENYNLPVLHSPTGCGWSVISDLWQLQLKPHWPVRGTSRQPLRSTRALDSLNKGHFGFTPIEYRMHRNEIDSLLRSYITSYKKAQVTANKMVHMKRSRLLDRFFFAFHVVSSVLLRVQAPETTFWQIEISL